MSHEEQKLNRKFESSERTLSQETNSVDAPISTRGEQAEAHQTAHKDDVTLSDEILKEAFKELYNAMNNHNWFRIKP